MAEVLADYSETIVGPNAVRYHAQAVGASGPDGMWEAWIEFRALDGRPVRVTDRETTQPNRQAVEYWSTGLEPIYFEGAFSRAIALPA